jgi:post-segregation antitoxin (ccd killing protein)
MAVTVDASGKSYKHTTLLIPLDIHQECRARKLNMSEIASNALREKLQNE